MRYRVSFLKMPESVMLGDYVSAEAKAYRDASSGFVNLPAAVSWAASLGLYERVVNLEADNLEAVFRPCNSIDDYWADVLPDSANASILKKGGLRSMSVGDLVDDGAGNYWVVARMGFEKVAL